MNTTSSEAEQLYWNIFKTNTDGLIISHLETGRVLEANPAACAMHGYTHTEFVGLLPAAFIHPDSQKVFSKFLRENRSGSALDTRVLHVPRDSNAFHAELRGTAFTWQGQPCLLSVVRDVSQRIQAEQRLHQRIEDRTREQSKLLEISHTTEL
jgi:PAS domain S-box-containing protein